MNQIFAYRFTCRVPLAQKRHVMNLSRRAQGPFLCADIKLDVKFESRPRLPVQSIIVLLDTKLRSERPSENSPAYNLCPD